MIAVDISIIDAIPFSLHAAIRNETELNASRRNELSASKHIASYIIPWNIYIYGTPFVTKIHLFLGVLLTYKDSF